MEYRVETADDAELVVEGVVPIEMLASADDSGYETARAIPAIMCPPPDGMNLVDREVMLSVTVIDHEQRRAADHRIIRLACPEYHPDLLNTCLRVCNREL